MILDRYIFRLWLGPFLGGLGIVLAILLLGRALKLLGEIGESMQAWAIMADLLLFTMPYFLLLTVPMAFFLSMQNTISSLQQNSEMDALRASGISYFRMFRSLLAAAILLWLALTWVAMNWMPQSQLNFNNLLLKVYQLKGAISFSPQRFSQNNGPITIYVDGEKEDGIYQGLLLEDRRQSVPVFYLAEEAEFRSAGTQLQLLLRNGTRLEGKSETQRMLRFDEYKISIPLHTVHMKAQKLGEHPTMMLPAQLWRYLQTKDDPVAIAEWNRRLTLPMLLLSLFFFALPLSLSPKRSGKAGSLLIGIGLLIVLYNIQLMLHRQVSQGELGGWSMWLSQGIQLACAMYLWRRAESDTLPAFITHSGESFYLLHEWIMHKLGRRLPEPTP